MMWMTSLPSAEEILRQGDLLDGILIPQLVMPLTYARPSGREPASDDFALVKVQSRKYVVVSQCCTIENSGIVAIAPIVSTRPLPPENVAPYWSEEPNNDSGYVYNAHAIEPVEGHVEETVVNGKKRLLIIDFTKIQTCSGDLKLLQQARVASMTPPGRRLLRIRLSNFWSRVEAEDAAWFDEHDLPAGTP